MKQTIKIGIQDDNYPIWLEGEVTIHQLKLIIKLLQIMLNNRIEKDKFKKEIKKSLKSGKPEPVWKDMYITRVKKDV